MTHLESLRLVLISLVFFINEILTLPSFVNQPSNIIKHSTENVNFTCIVTERNTTLTLTWWFLTENIQLSTDSVLLSDATKHYQVNTKSYSNGDYESTLSINNLTVFDNGLYECAIHRLQQQTRVVNTLLLSQVNILQVLDNAYEASLQPSVKNNSNFTDCCIEKRVPQPCLSACSAEYSDWLSVNKTSDCLLDSVRILDCASGGHNHIPCCYQKKVSSQCLGLCHRSVSEIKNELFSQCSAYTATLIDCFHLDYDLLPSPPVYLSAESISPSRISISWLESAKTTDNNSTVYRVLYKQMDQRINVYRSSDLTTDLTLILTGLIPNTPYSVHVIAVNKFGSSQPSYTILSTTDALTNSYGVHEDFSISECCQEQQVNPECQQLLCSAVAFEAKSFTHLLPCYPHLNKVLQCYTGMQNHTECCKRYGVPVKCYQLCTGQVRDIQIEQLDCLDHLEILGSCIVEGQDVLPAHPKNVILTHVTHNSARLIWNEPSVNAQLVQHYVIRYRRYKSTEFKGEEQQLEYIQKSTSEVSSTLDSLQSNTMYEVNVMAAGQHGLSLPSPAIVFLTYPTSSDQDIMTTAMVPIYQQSPLQDLQACCVSQGVSRQCLKFCDYSLSVEQIEKQHLFSCLRYFNQFLLCANDGRNHRTCCVRRGIDEDCLEYCSVQSNSSLTASVKCLADVPSMLTCFKENIHVVPTMPRELTVVNVSEYTVSLVWKSPKTASTVPVLSYSVQYKREDEQLWNRVEVNKTEIILQNLQADRVYWVQVCSVSKDFVSYPTPKFSITTKQVYLNKNVSVNEDITDCCRARNVSVQCMSACNSTGLVNLHKCSAQLEHVIYCAADETDHSECCRHKNIPEHCLEICKGRTTAVASVHSLICLAFVEGIFSCFRESNQDENFLAAPQGFTFTELGSTYATFTWTNRSHASRPITYSLIVIHTALGSFNIYENIQNPYTVRGLESATRYTASIRAVTEQATSPQSALVSFYTRPDDTIEVKITQDPEGVVDIDSKVSLNCTAVPGPYLSVYWLRNGRRIEGSILSIDTSTPRDAGRYTCVIVASGDYADSLDTFLRIKYLPTFQALTNHETVAPDNNETAHLHCHFSGYPNIVDWYKDGQPIDLYSEPRRYSSSKYMLEDESLIRVQLSIHLVLSSDLGQYACVGSNEYGSTTGHIWLTAPGVTVHEESRGAIQPSTFDVADCCRRSNVSSQCIEACTYDIDLYTVHTLGMQCLTDLPAFISCAADGADHTGCCVEIGVPVKCLSYCTGTVPVNTTLQCMAHVLDIVTCLERGHSHLSGKPEKVRATVDNGRINVSWESPAVNGALVSDYIIHYQSESRQTVNLAKQASRYDRTVLLTDVSPFTSYIITVVATNHHGSSQPSAAVRVATFELAPIAPADVTAKLTPNGKVLISWKSFDVNVLSHNIHYSPSADQQAIVKTVGKNVSEATLDNLHADTEYSVYLTAESAHCLSKPSNTVLITTPGHGSSSAKKHVVFGVGLFLLIAITIGLVAYLIVRRSNRINWRGLERFKESVSFENPGYTSLNEPQVHLLGDELLAHNEAGAGSALMKDYHAEESLTESKYTTFDDLLHNHDSIVDNE